MGVAKRNKQKFQAYIPQTASETFKLHSASGQVSDGNQAKVLFYSTKRPSKTVVPYAGGHHLLHFCADPLLVCHASADMYAAGLPADDSLVGHSTFTLSDGPQNVKLVYKRAQFMTIVADSFVCAWETK